MLNKSGLHFSTVLLAAIVVLQISFSIFFIVDMALELSGLRKVAVSWEYREIVQIITIIGMLLGAFLGTFVLVGIAKNMRELDQKMLVAKGAFHALMVQRFDEWELTPSEKDVALFTLKGLSNSQIAEARGKSIGTIKAQCNSIYQKAGVSGRTQLISGFIEDFV